MTITPTKINYGNLRQISYLYKKLLMKKLSQKIELKNLTNISSNGLNGTYFYYENNTEFNEEIEVDDIDSIISLLTDKHLSFTVKYSIDDEWIITMN